ncbi:MAG: redoxin domain-containing protein [Candidatus Nitrosoabyssus spongiisocia]|nr:MAG: redoxin domain-containing protein [Nitrosopumilaceae archaeon AB1(1)]
MKSEIRTAVIMGIVIVGVIAALGVSFSYLDQNTQPQYQNSNTTTLQGTTTDLSNVVALIDKSRYKQAPDLVGIAGYINTSPEELAAAIEGKVVLYDIWTYSCINCIRTLPFITAWDEKYVDDGLLIIGIHSPEFEFEKDLSNVQTAVDKHSINYPVILDNDKEIWEAFENRYWPRKYLADHEGYIRYDHIGEGSYDETELEIQKLLKERSESLGVKFVSADTTVDVTEFTHSFQRVTPELYFGYGFTRGNFGNENGFLPGQDVVYVLPKDDKYYKNKFYIQGTWNNMHDSMRLVSDSGYVVLPFVAKEVNIVAANNANLEISLDGEIISAERAGKHVDSDGIVRVSDSDLYNLVSTDDTESHLLVIKVDTPDFEIFTFTFG